MTFQITFVNYRQSGSLPRSRFLGCHATLHPRRLFCVRTKKKHIANKAVFFKNVKGKIERSACDINTSEVPLMGAVRLFLLTLNPPKQVATVHLNSNRRKNRTDIRLSCFITGYHLPLKHLRFFFVTNYTKPRFIQLAFNLLT